MRTGIYLCLGLLFSLTFLYIPFYVNVSELKARVIELVSIKLNEIPSKVARESTTADKGPYQNSLIHHSCEDGSTQLRDSEHDFGVHSVTFLQALLDRRVRPTQQMKTRVE